MYYFLAGHVFLQQPYHPTYFALERLDQCMTNTYSTVSCPNVPQPVLLNSVCAAPCDEGTDYKINLSFCHSLLPGWYRCQIVSYDADTEMCDIKYLDYGGYHNISVHSLRQIRTDFLSLPFQVGCSYICLRSKIILFPNRKLPMSYMTNYIDCQLKLCI